MSQFDAKLLEDSLAFIKQGWTQGTEARNADGEAVAVYNPEATCYCFVGAVHKAYCFTDGQNRSSPWRGLYDHLWDTYAPVNARARFSGPISFNDEDGRTVDEVVAVLEAMISKAKGYSK